MKRNYTVENDLLKRLEIVSHCGNPIADWLFRELKNPDRGAIFNGHADFFRMEICARDGSGTGITQVKIRYTSPDNRPEAIEERKKNPSSNYLESRSQSCGLSKFCAMFKNFPQSLKTNDELMEEFGELMKLGEDVHVRISDKFYDFKRAYNGANYAPDPRIDASTLHNSCMRYGNLNDSIAGFYKHAGGCRILVAENSAGKIMGRAIIWPHVFVRPSSSSTREFEGSLMSRMYYTCPGVRSVMIRRAQQAGINYRMKTQSLHCHKAIIVMNPPDGWSRSMDLEVDSIRSRLYPTPYFRGGCPYVDVFECIRLNTDTPDDPFLYLTNSGNDGHVYISPCTSTSGHLGSSNRICPVCGRKFEPRNNDQCICSECCAHRHLGGGSGCVGFSTKKVVKVSGYGLVPVECTKRNRLTKTAENSVLVSRMHKMG